MLHETRIFLSSVPQDKGEMVTGLLLSRRMINATQSYWTTLVELMTPEATADKMTREREKEGKGR